MTIVGIELPQVGESVTEAVIGKWLKQPGDTIHKFDALVEVVTDKVSMEFPAPYTGTLKSIEAKEGDTVPMGVVIAQMEIEGAAEDLVQEEEPEPNRVGTLIQGANVGPTGGTFQDTALEAQQDREAVPSKMVTRPTSSQSTENRNYSPVVARLAGANGIDLTTITGTGRDGRVTKQDVQAVIDSGQPAAPIIPDGALIEDRVIKATPVRQMIASHMVKSVNEIPHAWSTVEVDMTGLMTCRSAQRGLFRERHGVDLTFLAFTTYAVSNAIKDNPFINSSWEDGSIRLKGRINLGIAVAAPDGLVVPVLHDADREGITGLARRLAPLVERARSGSLSLDDVQGGTFTLNNTGTLGSILGGAIINHPQAAIVTTEAIVKRPVVLSGPQGDAIAIRSMMNICLSFDHRIIDGAEASAFLQSFKRNLEVWSADSELN